MYLYDLYIIFSGGEGAGQLALLLALLIEVVYTR